MIKSVIIKYFQSHKKTILKFHPGVNIITGSSDVGKSAILRDIIWGLENRPLGNDFISDFATKADLTKSIIKFDDCKITRGKNTKTGKNQKNYYKIDKGEELKALRSDVPDEVRNKTRMTEANLQSSQHFPLFLLNETPGKVAKAFSEIAGLQIMDHALTNTNSFVKNYTDIHSGLLEELKTNTKKLKELDWVDEAKEKITTAHKLSQKIEDNKRRKVILDAKISRILALQERLKKINRILSIESLLIKLLDIRTKEENLKYKIKKIVVIKRTIKSLPNLQKIESIYDDLKALSQDIEKDKKNLKRLNNLVNSIEGCLSKSLDLIEKITNTEDAYVNLMKKLKMCPTCYSSISKKIIEEIRDKIK